MDIGGDDRDNWGCCRLRLRDELRDEEARAVPDRYGFQLITGDRVLYSPDGQTRLSAVVLAVRDDGGYYIQLEIKRSQGAPFVLGDDGSVRFIDLTAEADERETLVVRGSQLEFRGDWADEPDDDDRRVEDRP